jgi:polysaccharide pyruvyl transferase WcaK-like protein
VRDPESLALLREIGVNKPPMEVTADPALLLTPPEYADRGDAQGQVLTVSLRPWQSTESEMADRLAGVCARVMPSAAVRTLSMQPNSDDGVADLFRERWRTDSGREAASVAGGEENRLASIVQALGESDLVIGMRLHALILAAAAGVPSVAIAYDPKIMAFMRSTGQEDSVAGLDASDELAAMVERVWRDRTERGDRLRERLPSLRAAAMRNGEVALSIIANY